MKNTFKSDLEFGQKHEDKIFSLLKMHKKNAEIKTEKFESWTRNGNMCIEVSCYGKPSGIFHPSHKKNNTKLWIHNFCEEGNEDYTGSIIFKFDYVKNLAENYKNKSVMGGDNNMAKLVLVPIKEIFDRKNYNGKGEK
tara:strand:+ start:1401 stop:1814 length:414 start_codon:yes stop_codon:yes gene_type:complete